MTKEEFIRSLYWMRGGDYTTNYAKSIADGAGGYEDSTVIDLENRTIAVANRETPGSLMSIVFKFRNDETPTDSNGDLIPVLSAVGSVDAECFKIGTQSGTGIVLSAASQYEQETETTNSYLIVSDPATGKQVKIKPQSQQDNAVVGFKSDLDEVERKISISKSNLTLLLEILTHSDALSDDYAQLNDILEDIAND